MRGLDDPHVAASKPEPVPRWRGFFLGLQCRLTLLIVGLTFSVAWLACTYLVQSSSRMLQREHADHALELASMLARTVGPVLATGDGRALAQPLRDLTQTPPMVFAVAYDASWSLVAQAAAPGYQLADLIDTRVNPLSPPLVGRPSFRGGQAGQPAFVEVVYPVNAGGGAFPEEGRRSQAALVGYVRAGMTVEAARSWTARTLDILSGVGIMIALLAVPLCFVMFRRIVRPLHHICRTMGAFAGGDLEARSTVRRRDEIGTVAAAFNRMADQHQRAHDRVLKLNADLERRVAQRTRELRELALRDPLTGLFNRRHFDEVLRQRFAEAQRYGGELACIMIDVDEFKSINDRFGHLAGDDVLMALTRVIQSQLRSSDVAARYGGDEFVILLPHTDAQRAQILADRVATIFRRELEHRLPHSGGGVSIGIADLAEFDLTEADQLVQLSDRALYQAKRDGKNRTVIADPAQSAVSS